MDRENNGGVSDGELSMLMTAALGGSGNKLHSAVLTRKLPRNVLVPVSRVRELAQASPNFVLDGNLIAMAVEKGVEEADKSDVGQTSEEKLRMQTVVLVRTAVDAIRELVVLQGTSYRQGALSASEIESVISAVEEEVEILREAWEPLERPYFSPSKFML